MHNYCVMFGFLRNNFTFTIWTGNIFCIAYPPLLQHVLGSLIYPNVNEYDKYTAKQTGSWEIHTDHLHVQYPLKVSLHLRSDFLFVWYTEDISKWDQKLNMKHILIPLWLNRLIASGSENCICHCAKNNLIMIMNSEPATCRQHLHCMLAV